MKVLLGILVVAAVTTAGDYAWFELGVGNHKMMAGIIHGAVLLTAVGGALGASAGRLVRGLPMGTIAGIGGALVYYSLAGLARLGAMLVAWAACWVILSALDGRFLRQPPRGWLQIAARGLVAAAAGGAAFSLIYETVWGHEAATGRNYVIQFLAWTVGWAPGILAIALGGTRRA